MDLKGKVAIVTGASSGIGRATASLLAKHGVKVVLAAPKGPKLDQAAKEIPHSLAIPTDMTDERSVRDMVRQAHKSLGRIDILINNAGRGYEGSLEFVDIEKFIYLLKLNAVGPLVAMQEVAPIMRKQKGGRIINVSSSVFKWTIPHLGAYAATKAALNCIMLTSRKELAKDNIEVSIFYPFHTASNFGKSVFRTDEGLTPIENNPNMPDKWSPEQNAMKLLQAIQSHKKEFSARSPWMFPIEMAKKKLNPFK
jgi:short-subunit dehydrogenase